jgi:hypothetical protein
MTTSSRDDVRRDLAVLLAGRGHVAERFLAEIEFAEELAKRHPDKAKRWTKFIADASALVARAVASRKLDRLEPAVREAEAALAPIGKVAKTYTVTASAMPIST